MHTKNTKAAGPRRGMIAISIFTLIASLAFAFPVVAQVPCCPDARPSGPNGAAPASTPVLYLTGPIGPTPQPDPQLLPPGASTGIDVAPLSYYVDSTDANAAYALGAQQGMQDASVYKSAQTLVILDFGQPNYNASTNTYDAYLTRSDAPEITNSQIEAVAKSFALGYANAVIGGSSALFLIIGTNNVANLATYYDHGAAWANLVIKIQADINSAGFAPYVRVEAGNDVEGNPKQHFEPPSLTRTWFAGFASVANTQTPPLVVFDYGDAGGCPENSYMRSDTKDGTGLCCLVGQTCSPTSSDVYTQGDFWYISFGSGVSLPLPEIYNTGGANARQWGQIALYSQQQQHQFFPMEGPLVQAAACSQPGAQSCTGIDNTAQMAYSQLTTVFSAPPLSTSAFSYYSDIKHQ